MERSVIRLVEPNMKAKLGLSISQSGTWTWEASQQHGKGTIPSRLNLGYWHDCLHHLLPQLKLLHLKMPGLLSNSSAKLCHPHSKLI